MGERRALSARGIWSRSASAHQLSLALGVPANRISDIVRERRSVTADTALRHGKYFGSTPQFWLNLQMAYDLSRAEAETDLSEVSRRRAG